jgi:hypothetical protein
MVSVCMRYHDGVYERTLLRAQETADGNNAQEIRTCTPLRFQTGMQTWPVVGGEEQRGESE